MAMLAIMMLTDLWDTKFMYCYEVKSPVFSLQRELAKSPLVRN